MSAVAVNIFDKNSYSLVENFPNSRIRDRMLKGSAIG